MAMTDATSLCHHPQQLQHDPASDPPTTSTHLAEWQQDPLHEGPRLEERLPQRQVEMGVQLLVEVDVIPDARQKHQVEEALGHLVLEVGGKDAGGLVHGSGRPRVRA